MHGLDAVRPFEQPAVGGIDGGDELEACVLRQFMNVARHAVLAQVRGRCA
jgi:hypothetical protein